MTPTEPVNPTARSTDDAAPAAWRPRWVRYTTYAVAVVALGAAVWYAVAGVGVDGWRRLREADALDAAGLLLLAVVNIPLNATIYWLANRPFDRHAPVRLSEMTLLQAAAVLLNYLPMQAGMIARAAYLKRVHGIGYRTSVAVVLWFVGTAVAVMAWLGVVTLWRRELDAAWWLAAGAGLVAGAWVIACMQPIVVRRFPGVPAAWFDRPIAPVAAGVLAVLVLRALDVACFGARLWLAARVFGTPIPFAGALAIAALGTIAVYLSPLPNGMGLREAVFGLLAAAGLGGPLVADASTAVAVALVDRAAEALVIVTLGPLALARLHRLGLRTPAPPDPPADPRLPTPDGPV